MATIEKEETSLAASLLVSEAAAHPLETLLRPTWAGSVLDGAQPGSRDGPRVVCAPGAGTPMWLSAGDWRMFVRPCTPPAAVPGEILETFACADGTLLHAWAAEEQKEVVVPFSLDEAFTSYVSEAWAAGSSHRRLSERQLNAFYRAKSLLPRPVQLAARRALVRAQGTPDFPLWPLDTSVSRLLAFYAQCSLRAAQLECGELLWFWPESYHAALVLTHDVEGVEGIRLALEVADLEEEHGFRSSFNFGAWYDIDPGVLRELVERGFEVGMHSLTHDRALFASRAAFETRLPALRALADRLGAVGFRSPATHRVFSWLGELPVEYDCTIPNSDPYEPQPGGCCSVFPFFVGPVVELPYTLPQDHTLLTLLRHRSPALWLEQAAAIEREHGLIQCLSHPDPGYLGDRRNREVYAEFLRGMAERDGVWRALPQDVAAWWRRRARAQSTDTSFARGVVRLVDDARRVVFERPVDAGDPDRPHAGPTGRAIAVL